MSTRPKVSICVPIHDMKNGDIFLDMLRASLNIQTFKDYELVITKEGKMAENTNAAIKKAKGEIIKILYMDDRFAHPDALKNIVEKFDGGWLATGCIHDNGKELYNKHMPSFDGIVRGQNTIGSPSVIAFENKDPLLFDENMTWLLDVDYYKRLAERYGFVAILNEVNVILGTGDHQMTNILTHEDKVSEGEYLRKIWQN